MAIDMAATDEIITLELGLEHEVPPPNDTSQKPSHFLQAKAVPSP
jgi:hypothetical protein